MRKVNEILNLGKSFLKFVYAWPNNWGNCITFLKYNYLVNLNRL
jgi:hypothetical protein